MSMSARSTIAIKNWTLPLQNELASHNLELGNPVFFRIIKQPSMTTSTGRLEAFVENTSGEFEFFKAWDICNYSGDLGPKLKQGDRQPPEGFYFVTPAQLNPNSSYHLSFNLGYPNAYDRAHERTGDFLMVHGDCVSVGCYAMTDTGIEEIYTLLQSALAGGQDFVRVHAFPFPMTDENMRAVEGHKNFPFWQNLQEGWNWFETYKRPPNTEVKSKRYVFAADR
ncbi:MAG: murein L,D-transpeptidase family protein [Litorimonas sp.]